MRLPLLDPRLRRLLDLLPDHMSRLIDVGTDHCYLPLHLLAAGRVEQILAIDCKIGPLEQGKQNVARFGFQDRVTFQLSDGLYETDLSAEDWIVIAGMGGLEIRDILSAASLVPGVHLLLQPMKSLPELRHFLMTNTFLIVDEQLATSKGRYFPILHVTVGTSNDSETARHSYQSNLEFEIATYVGSMLCNRENQDTVTQRLWPMYREKELQRAEQIAARGGPVVWRHVAEFYREEKNNENKIIYSIYEPHSSS
ncbi:MAG TPA: SAM-dependent methyltransferase [Clostridiaceae bacterium]|nr:SAM-dependent methyltransferase [Clostridiaceae bacterium]